MDNPWRNSPLSMMDLPLNYRLGSDESDANFSAVWSTMRVCIQQLLSFTCSGYTGGPYLFHSMKP